MSGRAFISYSHHDRSYVDALAKHLAEAGIQVWYDHVIATGDRFDKLIKNQIDTCSAFMVVMTASSDASDWVANELNHAIDRGKQILPLLLDGEPFFALKNKNYEDIRHGRMPRPEFVTQLAKLVGRPIAPASPQPMVQVKAGELIGHTDTVHVVEWSPDGRILATLSGDGTARTWDATTGQELRTHATGSGGLTVGLAWSPDGRHLATVAHEARIWDAFAGSLIHTLKDPYYSTGSVTWSPNGHYIATPNRIWDLATGKTVHKLYKWLVSKKAIWSPDGRRIAADTGKSVRIWDVATGQILHKLPHDSKFLSMVNAIDWSPDGNSIATASTDQAARIWDATTGRILHTLTGHTGEVGWISWTPDGRHAITTSHDGTMRLWDTATGSVQRIAQQGLNLAWSLDGRFLVTADKEEIHIRNVLTGQILHTFTGYSERVYTVAWSPDGRHLAAASGCTVQILDNPAAVSP